jgi:hypothetical protein
MMNRDGKDEQKRKNLRTIGILFKQEVVYQQRGRGTFHVPFL